MSTTGGDKLEEAIRKAKQASPIDGVDVGFFESSRYPPVRTGKNGGQKQEAHYVATVAAWQEFGTKTIPERPAIRTAIGKVERSVIDLVAAEADSATGHLDEVLAGRLGELVKGEIQSEIVSLRTPANSPRTIERKGSSNPLLDTSQLLNSVAWKTIKE